MPQSLYLPQTYRYKNKDGTNQYQQLEKCGDFGLLHDAATHWVKELNTVFLREVNEREQ